MLQLTIQGQRFWNEEDEEFVYPEPIFLELEHSLVTLSKWESEFEKPFLSKDEKSEEEVLRYIEIMIQTPNVSPEVFQYFTDDHLREINDYMSAKMTATWFNDPPAGTQPPNREVITAELVYYWMISYEMPVEPFQHWHLNRLFTLLKVFSAKNSKKQKMNPEQKKDWLADRQRLNDLRKQQMGTDG